MPKALITATVLSHIAQFHEPAIALLKEYGYEVHVAGRNNLAEKHGLTLTTPDRIFEVPFERNPLSPRNVMAARQLRQILRKNTYDIIHCNTPVAGVVTRLLGQRARAKGARLVYTAHGFHFFDGAPRHNWLIYYPLERLLARFTDVLVTINTEDHKRAQRFPAREVRYIPGVGVDLERFGGVPAADSSRRQGLGLKDDDFVVLSVGELNDNKNHATVIRAIAQMDDPRVQYLICGNGPRRQQLEDWALEFKVGERVHFLGYRRDIPEMLAVADVFCLPSYREGLPLSLIEAMASGRAAVCTNIRGTRDLAALSEGVIVVQPPTNVAGFTDAFRHLETDVERRRAMGRKNRESAKSFSIEAVAIAMADIYGLRTMADRD